MLKRRLVHRSQTVKVRLDEIAVYFDRPRAGDPCAAYASRRSGRSRSRISRGQTPVAHHETGAAARAEPDPMGSAGARSLHAFGVTRTPEQDGRDTEALYPAVLPPRPGETQVSPAL